ncbi:hypothetical protein [Thiocystis violacea]|uniref:O-linked N-acetylglucosamine transferase, SPINDLY family protein n=1 Tax=Thiocystis violacea TaxID=13725 RepID=UPI0019042392|nr:hypothetical protein [Thiocystis violacea]MBK1718872.1 hypothetical protein [Thiocystis violacea]
MINYSISWSSKPPSPASTPGDPLVEGIAAHRRGEIEPAIEAYVRALRARPDRVVASYNLGVALIDSGMGLASLPFLGRAVRQWPTSEVLRAALLHAWLRAGRWMEAEPLVAEGERAGVSADTLARWRAWIAAQAAGREPGPGDGFLSPAVADASHEPPDSPLAMPKGSAVHERLQEPFARALRDYQSGRIETLLADLDGWLAEQPSWGEGHHLRGLGWMALKRFDQAGDALARACELIPGRAELWDHLGVVRARLGDVEGVRKTFEQSLMLNPLRAETWNNAADAALTQDHLEGAFQYALQAVRLAPDLTSANYCLLQAAYKLAEDGPAGGISAEARFPLLDFAAKVVKERATSPERAISVAPLLADIGRFEDAVEVLGNSFERFGNQPASLLGDLVRNQLHVCDWHHLAERQTALLDLIRRADRPVVKPFTAIALTGLEASDLRRVARLQASEYAPWSARADELQARASKPADARLRIGYLSDDFQEHATAYLTASLFERHDRDRFEVFAYSSGHDDGGPMRGRLRAAFEHFVDIRPMGPLEAARRIREDGIDILVDLKGYTKNARIEILALRPSPIQVTWLGFPGGLGAAFIDYLIADPIVLPPDQTAHYDEAIAYLPDAYAPVDERRRVAETPTRAAVGLPDTGFVFCCFNDPYKITPDVFDRWCRLLQAVPDSVLWLYARTAAVRANLARAAADRGVSEDRLIFADRRPQAEHLARIALADLFLDTLPVNAHTTASDALWMGVPLVTCLGETFQSRVAASLLSAVGVRELIAANLDEYQALALELATHPARLADLKARLIEARDRAPFFDGERFARNLEALYRRIWERHMDGLEPCRLEPIQAGAGCMGGD